MRVGVYTNNHIKCGNATHGRDLVQYLSPYFEMVASNEIEMFFRSKFDAVIINWHPARIPYTIGTAHQLHSVGAKVIVEYQNSIDGEITLPASDPLLAADAIVAHEPMQITNKEVEFIPVGIPIVDGLEEPKEPSIGCAGFPFDWKRFDVVAEAAKKFNVKCRMIAPNADIMSMTKFVDGLRGHVAGNCEILTQWLSTEETVQFLAQNTLNIYFYQSIVADDTYGQSGSVRMGVAARRPMIISTHRKLRTLHPYCLEPNAEFYLAHSEEEVYLWAESILRAPEKALRPKRVLEEQGWPTVGLQYRNLIERVCAA